MLGMTFLIFGFSKAVEEIMKTFLIPQVCPYILLGKATKQKHSLCTKHRTRCLGCVKRFHKFIGQVHVFEHV